VLIGEIGISVEGLSGRHQMSCDAGRQLLWKGTKLCPDRTVELAARDEIRQGRAVVDLLVDPVRTVRHIEVRGMAAILLAALVLAAAEFAAFTELVGGCRSCAPVRPSC
jgi:hypothetical protein